MQSVQRLHSTNSDQRLDMARWRGVHTDLPATHTFIHELTPKGWKAELA